MNSDRKEPFLFGGDPQDEPDLELHRTRYGIQYVKRQTITSPKLATKT